MDKTTQLLLKIAAGVAILYFAWALGERAILWPWQERSLRVATEQKLQECLKGK